MKSLIHSPLTLEQQSQSLARTHTRTVNVRWASWSPFLHPSVMEVTVALVGGPQRSPDDALVYKVPINNMQDESMTVASAGLLAFRWAREGVSVYNRRQIFLHENLFCLWNFSKILIFRDKFLYEYNSYSDHS